MQATVHQEPYRIAEETWVVPQLIATGPDELVCINSMLIVAAEPVLVDTGTALNRGQWLEDAFSIVEPADVRWIFLSHGDRDHTGNVEPLLELCPRATVVTTMWGMRYMLADGAPPVDRMRWVNDGESFPAGDRVLGAVRPPLWDATGTRGLYDPTTGVLWAADCFASMLTHPVGDAQDLDHGFWRDSFTYEHRSYSEWLALLDPVAYDRHVARTESLRPEVVASAHGPVLSGRMVDEAYCILHEVARLGPVPPVGQPVLEQMIAAASFDETARPAA